VVGEISVIAVQTLSEAVDFIRGALGVVPERFDPGLLLSGDEGNVPDFSEVAGQEHVKRAMEIAAAGGHNLLMAGPPGSGKTMMARRFAGILPDLTFEESLETTKIFSVAGLLDKEQALVTRRPFRSPHHTISDAGMIGGGNIPRPGEISLAHNGVLFMDELPEFRRPVLEALRQPLEDRKVTISRAAMSITYPSCFMLVAAMNPCPCGYLTDHKTPCRCSHYQLQKYRDRISGPLLDRIDIHVDVPAVGYGDLTHPRLGEASGRIRKRVSAARKTQTARFGKTGIHNNAGMKNRHIKMFCRIDDDSGRLLRAAIDTLGLSARAYNRILKIARTIADLAGETDIRSPDVAEAIQYRSLDRKP
jgi:magnesium chelatase family protein